jgi:hypothetical protein
MRLGSALPATVRNGHGRKNADGNKHAALASGLGLARAEDAQAPSPMDANAAPEIRADAARIKPPANFGDGDSLLGAVPASPSERLVSVDEGSGRPLKSGRKIDADMHALLYQRLTTLQDEQRSCWQKVLGLIPTPAQRRASP